MKKLLAILTALVVAVLTIGPSVVAEARPDVGAYRNRDLTDNARKVLPNIRQDETAQAVVQLFPEIYLSADALEDARSRWSKRLRNDARTCYRETFGMRNREARRLARAAVDSTISNGDGSSLIDTAGSEVTDTVPVLPGGVSIPSEALNPLDVIELDPEIAEAMLEILVDAPDHSALASNEAGELDQELTDEGFQDGSVQRPDQYIPPEDPCLAEVDARWAEAVLSPATRAATELTNREERRMERIVERHCGDSPTDCSPPKAFYRQMYRLHVDIAARILTPAVTAAVESEADLAEDLN